MELGPDALAAAQIRLRDHPRQLRKFVLGFAWSATDADELLAVLTMLEERHGFHRVGPSTSTPLLRRPEGDGAWRLSIINPSVGHLLLACERELAHAGGDTKTEIVAELWGPAFQQRYAESLAPLVMVVGDADTSAFEKLEGTERLAFLFSPKSKVLRHVGHWPGLKRLQLAHCEAHTLEGIDLLPGLEAVDITACPFLDDAG